MFVDDLEAFLTHVGPQYPHIATALAGWHWDSDQQRDEFIHDTFVRDQGA